MTITRKNFAIICVLALIGFAWVLNTIHNLMTPRVPGTLSLADYSEGFAMCGGEVSSVGEGLVVMAFPKYTLYINEGHEHDKEIVNLKVLALVHCNN